MSHDSDPAPDTHPDTDTETDYRFLDLATAGGFRRALMNELVAPRPVAWVSTRDAEGRPNLAPFSHFNVVSSAPPVVVFSCNTPEDRPQKDTLANVGATGVFTINIASFPQREAMVETSAQLPPGADEFAAAGLDKLPGQAIDVPRVAGAPASLECRLDRVVRIEGTGPGESDSHVVFGRVVGVHMRADLLDGEGRFRTAEAMPLGRLGGVRYVSTGDSFALPPRFRPRAG